MSLILPRLVAFLSLSRSSLLPHFLSLALSPFSSFSLALSARSPTLALSLVLSLSLACSPVLPLVLAPHFKFLSLALSPVLLFSLSPRLVLFPRSLAPSLPRSLPRSSVWNAQHDRSLNVLLIIGCPCADKLEEHIRLASWVR